MILPLILMSFTLSIDALGIGIAYSVRGVKIKLPAKIIIGLISMLVMRLSALFGTFLSSRFPTIITEYLGITILVIMGGYFIIRSLRTQDKIAYDFDHSSSIDCLEGLALGVALSADSISAGIAAATLGVSGLALSISVGLLQIAFLCAGSELVRKNSRIRQMNDKLCGIISGLIFLSMAFIRLISAAK